MPDSEAEVCVVLKDGKVVGRWIGRDAELILSMIVNVHHYGASDEEDLRRCDPKPTVTKPLRKVTEVLGRYQEYQGEKCTEHYIQAVRTCCDPCCDSDTINLPDMLPAEATEIVNEVETRTMRYRITVEAVEEKDR